MSTPTMRDSVPTSSGAPVASATTRTAATGAGGAADGSRSPPVSSPLPGLTDSGPKPPRREPYRPFAASPTPSATNVTSATASAPPTAGAAAASPAALFASSLSLDLQRRVALRSEAVARARADSGSGKGNAAAPALPSMACTSFVSPRSCTGNGGGSGTLNGLAAHALGTAVSAMPSHSTASSSLPGPSPFTTPRPLTSSASPAATTALPAAAGGPSAGAAQGARAAGGTRNGAAGGLSGRSPPPPPPSGDTASLPDAAIQRVRVTSMSSSSMKAAAAAVHYARTGSQLNAISESARAGGGSTELSASPLVPAPSRHAVPSSWTSDAAPVTSTVGASAAAAVAPHSSTFSHTIQGCAGDAATSVYDLSIKSTHDSVGSPVLPCAAPSPTPTPLPPPPKWAPHLREVFKPALPTRTGRHAESSQRSMHAAFVHVLQRERVREVVARAWRMWVLHSATNRSQRGRRVAATAAQKTAVAARSSFADAERRDVDGDDGSGAWRERRVTQSPFRLPSSAASASHCVLPTWAPVGSSDSGAPCSLVVDRTRVAYMDPMALGGSGGAAGDGDDGGSDIDAVLSCASDDDGSFSEPVAAAALGDANVRLPSRSPTLTSPRRSPSQSHQQQQPPQRVRMPHARSYRKHIDGDGASCGAAHPGLSDGVPPPPPPPRAPSSSSAALAGRVSSAVTPVTSSAATPTGVASSSALRSSATPQLSASRSRSLGREASLGLPPNASFPTTSAGASASSAGAGTALLRPLHTPSPSPHALPSTASPLRPSSTTKSLQHHQQQQQQVTSPLAASAASAAGGASGGVGVGGGVATGNGDGPHVSASPLSTAAATGAAAAAAAAAAERRRSMVQHLLAGKSPRAVSPHPSGNTGGGSGRSPVYEPSMSRPHSRTHSEAGMSTGNGGTSMLMRLHRPLSGSAAGAMSDAAEERSSSSLLFTPRGGAAVGGGGGARGASGISAAVPSSTISGGGVVGTPLDFSTCSSASTPATQSMTVLSLITTAPMLLSREVEMRCAMYAREERRRQRLQRDMSGAMDALMMAALHRRSTERGLHPSLRQSTTSSLGQGRGLFSKNNSSSDSDGNGDFDGDDNVVAASELVDCAEGRVSPRGLRSGSRDSAYRRANAAAAAGAALGNACADFVSATQLSAAAVRARAATSTATSSSGRVAAWGRVSPSPGLVVSTAAAAAAPQQVAASRLRLRLQDTFVENSSGSFHGGTRAAGVEDYDDWCSDVTDERAGSRVSFTAHSRDGCAGRGGGGAGDVGGVHGAVVDDDGVDTITAASDRSARALATTRQWGAQVMETIVMNTTSTPTAADRTPGRGGA